MTRRTLALALVPLVLLGVLLTVLVWSRPADSLRGANVPPVERLSFQRVTLEPEGIIATVMNDGPDPITIAQLQVDEAFWTFTADRGLALDHLDRTTLTIPYPWVEGETHFVKVLTSTGTPFEHRSPSPWPPPRPIPDIWACSRSSASTWACCQWPSACCGSRSSRAFPIGA